MANLQSASITGLLTISNQYYQGGNSDITGWIKLSHCYDPYSRLHIRTPLPFAAISAKSSTIEVIGYHTYSGEHVHDFKYTVDNNSGTFSAQKISDNGYESNPYVYLSTSQYNTQQRVCFAVDKVTCCCTGFLWVRWWNNASYYADYAWATMGANDTQKTPVKQF